MRKRVIMFWMPNQTSLGSEYRIQSAELIKNKSVTSIIPVGLLRDGAWTKGLVPRVYRQYN